MKRINLIFVFLLTGLSSTFSQEYAIDKKASWISLTGNYMNAGGSLFEDSHNNNSKTSSLSFSFSHFVSRNFFIGGGMSSSNQSGASNARSLGIGPFIGYAFGNADVTAYPYIDLGLSYYSINSNPGLDIFSDFGFVFEINRHLGLTVEVGYHSMKLKTREYSPSESGNILSLSLGFVGLLF